jgi:hypothetical protein
MSMGCILYTKSMLSISFLKHNTLIGRYNQWQEIIAADSPTVKILSADSPTVKIFERR